MEIEEEQIEWGQSLVLKFMTKDRGNLKYLNLTVVIIGILTYLWAIDTEGDNPYFYIIPPIIVILFGGIIIYFTWYWKRGPGAIYLDHIENFKLDYQKDPELAKLEAKLITTYTEFPIDDNKVIFLADKIVNQQEEIEANPEFDGFLLLLGAKRMKARSLYNIGRYREAKAECESIISWGLAKRDYLDTSTSHQLIKECMVKISTPPPPKICPHCQTSNSPTSNQCELCLSQI